MPEAFGCRNRLGGASLAGRMELDDLRGFKGLQRSDREVYANRTRRVYDYRPKPKHRYIKWGCSVKKGKSG